MTKYIYQIDNQIIETLDVNSIPQGVEYTSVEFEENPVPVIEVPFEVQLWRLRAVLKITGREAQVETAISALSEPLKTGVSYAWQYGTIVERFSQTVILLQSILQLTESDVDGLFIQANNISI